ncbi:hypothetical protein AB0269_01175 [Microbacterium sp. NPDC077644]|uniref:hypothetical protein n=1 Tax=Microbacterium sp. NPDC077644 TaxID=3155055 RepID=UPI00344BA50C
MPSSVCARASPVSAESFSAVAAAPSLSPARIWSFACVASGIACTSDARADMARS